MKLTIDKHAIASFFLNVLAITIGIKLFQYFLDIRIHCFNRLTGAVSTDFLCQIDVFGVLVLLFFVEMIISVCIHAVLRVYRKQFLFYYIAVIVVSIAWVSVLIIPPLWDYSHCTKTIMQLGNAESSRCLTLGENMKALVVLPPFVVAVLVYSISGYILSFFFTRSLKC